MVSTLLWLIGAALLIAGPAMIIRGIAGRNKIKHELTEQKIVFPAADNLPTALARHAGLQVRTGEQAMAYSDLISTHVSKATAGRTYSEIADEWLASGCQDQQLARLRETAFMGQTLRGSLLGAYQAWQITVLVIGLGGLLAAIGLVFVALAGTWR